MRSLISIWVEKREIMNIKNFFNFFKKMGPGFVTGASDDDPSGLTTYAQIGAQYGFSILWTALWMIPLMACVQEMAGRIAIIRGEGVTKTLLKKFPRPLVMLLVLLLLIANIITIGADIAGMAACVALITPLPYMFSAIILTLGIVTLEVLLPYKQYVEILKFLCLSLLSYVAVACVAQLDWKNIMYHTVIPSITVDGKEFWYMIIALLGTTISPYLIFWQSSQEVEEKKARGLPLFGATQQDIHDMRQDTWFGMIFSNIIMFFVIVVSASFLFGHHVEINTMADAASVLQPLAGSYASWLFSFGVVGTGLLAIPILAGSAAYAIADLFEISQGLDLTWSQARGFYGIILASTLIGLAINFIGVNVVDFLIFSAVVNGLAMPFVLGALLLVANDEALVGQYKNSLKNNVLGWGTFAIFVGSIIMYLVV